MIEYIRKGTVKHDKYKKQFTSLTSRLLQPLKDDVLLAKDGSYFKYAFVVAETIDQAVLSSIAILRPDTTQILPVFLQYYLLTDRIYKLAKDEFITGMGLKRIILDDIKKKQYIFLTSKTRKHFANTLKKLQLSATP